MIDAKRGMVEGNICNCKSLNNTAGSRWLEGVKSQKMELSLGYLVGVKFLTFRGKYVQQLTSRNTREISAAASYVKSKFNVLKDRRTN